jgi:hypothetical protein
MAELMLHLVELQDIDIRACKDAKKGFPM